MNKKITTPITDDVIKELKAGEMAYLSGTIYTLRDAGHKRLVEMLDRGEEMPINFDGQVIYYAGPCPNRPEFPIGSVGPTTAGRMDLYSPRLIEEGLKVMIGKGSRDESVKKSIRDNTGVYLICIGGAAALMSKCVKSAKVIAFDDLGAEAFRELEVEDLPVIVAYDCNGNDVYSN